MSNGLTAAEPDLPTHTLPQGLSVLWLLEHTNPTMSRPLRSGPITGPSPLLQAGPPARPHRYSTPPVSAVCAPSRPAPRRIPTPSARQYRTLPSHVPCRSSRPSSRRLHAGHRLARNRTPAKLIPEQGLSGPPDTSVGLRAVFAAFRGVVLITAALIGSSR